MKKQKLLICMLSSTLVLPSLPVSHVHAETAKHISETPQSEETSSDESSSHDDKSKSEETPSDETASSNEETQTEKSSSSNKKEENTKSSKTKDRPRATQKEQRDEDSDRTSSYLNDHFSNDYDFINPSPFKSLSLSNMWHTWFSSNHQATESNQPSTETPSSEAPTTDNTTSTDEAQSTPTSQAEPSSEPPATESTPSRDNSHLSESDKAIADELDRISDSTVPSQTSDEQNHTSQEPSSTEETTEPSTTQDATEETSATTETPKTNAETETSKPSTDEDASASSSDDHVIDAVLDEYSEKSKDTASHYENQKNQNNTQTKNPQLPSKEAYQKRETPKQSFEDDFKDANLRSTATFETLPGFSGSDDSQDFVIAENKSTRDFIKKIAKDAHDIGQREDIYASVMMAQAILESNSGNSALARAPHYNLFGIKGAYKGQSATFNTLEDNGGQMYQISASFRSYPNQKASLQDYADLMKNGIDGNPDIYKPTWKSEAASYRSATEHLSTTYATDSHYADKLNSIIKHYDLTRFDKKQMPDLTHDTTTPEEVGSDFKPFVETDGTSPYPHGQCTWYVYNRMAQYGLHIGGNLGDARNWDNRAEDDGYNISMTPKTHSAVVFEAGQQGADSVYGHVAFVEKVNRDGSIVISESNVKGLGVISYRTIGAQEAQDLTYIQGKH